MKGKVTSSVGQRLALCPVFPHEKHFTSAQLRRTCRNLGPSPGDCCPVKYVCSNASNPVGSTGVGGASSLFTVSDINSWVNFSNGVTFWCPHRRGGGLQELMLPTVSLTIHQSDPSDCFVYSLRLHRLVHYHSPFVPLHKSGRPVLVPVY